MTPDPEPKKTIVNLNGNSSKVQSDAFGLIISGLLELQRQVPGVVHHWGKILISQVLNKFWKRVVGRPERRTSKVIHSFFAQPA